MKDRFYRRGLANVIAGIARYGITVPQRLFAPFLVVWDFTKMCNLRCQHCYSNAGKMGHELTLLEKLELVNQLDEAGVVAISFSGGEPLMSSDFWLTAEHAKRLGFHVSVATNGTLIDEDVAKKLKGIVDYVEISLDSPNPKAHDSFRGVKGAFEGAIERIKNCIKAGIQTGIATTATKKNLSEIPELVELVEELGAYRLVVFNFVPTGRGKGITDMDLNDTEIEWLLKFLYDSMPNKDIQLLSTSPLYAVVAVKRIAEGKGKSMTPTHLTDVCIPKEGTLMLSDFIGGCGAGRLYCGIRPNGDITPCVFIPIVVGNYRESFIKVWQENRVLEALRDRDSTNYGCSKCEYRCICGGCRARAYGYYGDLYEIDPGCFLSIS